MARALLALGLSASVDIDHEAFELASKSRTLCACDFAIAVDKPNNTMHMVKVFKGFKVWGAPL
jgi:hypothetical protein